MRYIRTTNNQIEFIEANDEGKILSSIGLQLGEVYFQIKNKKVAFYLNDSEKPFDNFIWSMNIPITIDGETYEDEDEVSNVLHNIMNDRFQEQLDELRENLAAEEARAQEAEAQLDDKIDDESARAIAAENRLQDQVTELSGAVAVLDNRVTNVENDLSALTDTVNDEITRSTAKDAEHDTAISALTNSLNNEITRATSAETVLHNEITAEEARAFAAESAITSNLNAEIARSVGKDAEHDAQISGLTNSLNSEIQRAQNAESALTDALNSEIQRALSAETSLHNEILAETNRAQAAESGLTNSINTEISRATSVENALRSDLTSETSARVSADTALQTSKADKVSAVASAIYNTANKTIDFKNISGTVISTVDARDFIKDGMVDTASISDNNLIITFNTDAGKEDIVIPLTDIFDPTNYYDKSAIDNIVSGINNSIETKADKTTVDALSGDVATISGNVNTISGNVNTLSGEVVTLSGEVATISGNAITSGEVQTMIDQAVSGKQDTLTAGRAIDITNNVVSFTLPISAGTGENSVVEGYQTKVYSNYCHAEGRGSTAGKSGSNNGYSSHAEGEVTLAEGNMSHSEGNHTQANGNSSHAEGNYTKAIGSCSHAEGSDTMTYNDYEHASGKYNKSTKLSSTYGSGGNTLFSVGNGVKNTNLHNTFEVRQNGDIYIADTSQITGTGSGETEGHNFYDVPMIKLQDALAAAGGSGVTSGQVQTMIDNSISGKQDTLVSGTNIKTINNESILGSGNITIQGGTTYTAGDGISISNQNVISTTTKFWCGTQAQYDLITIKDPNTVYMIHE